MKSVKKEFICRNCGFNSPKWEGKCKSCGEWNTFVEEIKEKKSKQEEKRSHWDTSGYESVPQAILDIKSSQQQRIPLVDMELSRVLGGGIVPGSLILLGGQPGIGKSTLLLQLALKIQQNILYITGEESAEQIKMRADRIGIENKTCIIYPETNVNKILKLSRAKSPDILIIDSIQTLVSPFVDSTAGTVSQIRECTGEIQRFAKEAQIPVFIIGHITKEGSIAGPKLLEHMVDVVLQFEGDQHYSYRILRSQKNRYGSTHEIGIYEMVETGLREISNPSELLIAQHEESLSGSTIGATVEGLRPLLIETQALVSSSVFGNPQRSSTGYDLRRLNMLLAVLEKRCGLPFVQNDVFLNIAGGIKIADPAIDLSIIAALISSLENIPVSSNICFTGEVGLSGEVRAVSHIEQRILEATRLGFEKIFISKYNTKGIDLKSDEIDIIGIGSISELLEQIFG